jgi:hypothetical protein
MAVVFEIAKIVNKINSRIGNSWFILYYEANKSQSKVKKKTYHVCIFWYKVQKEGILNYVIRGHREKSD